jgi:uncharacterized membrane protein SpoIIM required for sporulation
MVLDKFLNPQALRSKSYLAVPIGFFFVVLSFFSTSVVFPAEYSVIVVAFASMLTLPYVIKIFEIDELNIDLSEIKVGGELKKEELETWVRKCLRDGFTPKQIKRSLIENNMEKDILLLYGLGVLDDLNTKYVRESNFFTRHSKTVSFYCYLFIGMVLAFLVAYMLSGEEFRAVLFKHQINLIYGPKGMFGLPSIFYTIIANNIKIMLLCVFLSLFYGSGAILILAYNASIAGVLYGNFMNKAIVGESVKLVGAYLPHTTIEILAYLLAAVSGGILSKSLAEMEPGSRKLLLKDGLLFLIAGIVLTLVSGLVEVTIPQWILS